jgi:hypothetical protein
MTPLLPRPGRDARTGSAGSGTLAAALALLAVCPASAAQDVPRAPEYRIKAAFLYNFTLYTEWPPNAFDRPDSPLLLAVVGEDPFGSQLDAAVRGKTVNGRSIDVRRYERAADVPPCHLLFLSNAQAGNLPQVLRRFADLPLLIVGETEDFTRSGGTIRFFVEENKVRFEVNIDAALRAHVKFSSKLLSLARVVRDSNGPKDR